MYSIRRKWNHANLPCIAIQMRDGDMSWFTGYVGVPKDHIAYGKNYLDIDVRVHGGLTFGDFSEILGEGYYWLGFDTAHAGDKTRPTEEGYEWTGEEVMNEVEKLAEQIANLSEDQVLPTEIRDFLLENSEDHIIQLKEMIDKRH